MPIVLVLTAAFAGLLVSEVREAPNRAVGPRSHPSSACPSGSALADLDFTLRDIENREVTLSVFKGKVILLDFWSTTCPPCKVEIPWYVEFQRRYGGDGALQVIGVAVDDTWRRLVPYVRSMRMNYPVLQGRGNSRILASYGVSDSIPVAVLISRDGRICRTYTGAKSKEDVEEGINALLDLPPPR